MSIGLRLAALAVLSGVSVLPAGASAQATRQTPGSNISVTECYPHQHPAGYPGHPWIDPYGNPHPIEGFPAVEGFLKIDYTNRARVAAQEVDFGLISRGWLIAVAKDVGTFAPGVRIDHEFSLDPQVFPIGTALPYCAVLRVKFADGSEWRNPGVTAQ